MKRNGNAERRRRENLGAEGAQGWGLGRGYPLPSGGGLWEEGRAPPPKMFVFLCLAMVHFGAFWELVLMLV